MRVKFQSPWIGLTFLLLALPAFPQADDEQISRRHQETLPHPGEERTVTVGQAAAEEFDQREYLYAEARSDLRGNGKVLLPKGGLLWAKSASKEKVFCDVDLPGSICFTDQDGNGTFDQVRITGGSRVEGVSGSYREEWRPVKDENGRRWELVYLGAGGGILRFSSREWNGSGPPLQNEITYDLPTSGSTRFRYRNVEVEVLSAGNDGLRYRVVGANG